MSIRVETLHVGEYSMNCYLVENTDTREVVLVDPGADGRRIIADVGSRKPVAVLLTHGHYDHIGAVDTVCSHYGIPVYIHSADVPKLTNPALSVGAEFGYDTRVSTAPTPITDNQVLTLGGMRITCCIRRGIARAAYATFYRTTPDCCAAIRSLTAVTDGMISQTATLAS